MEKIIVVDFGGQYSHLIANCVRRLGVASDIWQPETPIEKYLDPKIRGVILSGGPSSVYDPSAPNFDAERFFENTQVPVLGICYGHQLIAQTFAKKYYSAVKKTPGKGEYGSCLLKISYPIGILKGLEKKEKAWMSHEDSADYLPPDFMLNASSPNSRCAGIQHIFRPIFGIQFHPEVTHTPCGMKIFENFFEICQVKKEWTSGAIYEEAKHILVEGVGDKFAIIFASGGVDSSVLLELAKQNLQKNKIIAIYVDTGLGEENEPEMVRKALTGQGLLEFVGSGKLPEDVEDRLINRYQKTRFHNLKIIRAKNRFFRALRNVYDPEKKRQIVGDIFIKIWREEVKKLGLAAEDCVLLQGTIYPDTIETARTRHSDKIKTHHNRVPLMQKLIEAKKVVEPFQYLYKDEVRRLGKMIGVDESMLSRHPRPGPGNSIRILCSESNWPPLDERLQAAFAIQMKLRELYKQKGVYAVFLPIKSTGVQGDQRTYAYTIALTTKEEPGIIWDLLLETASQILNAYKGIINRVVLTVYPKEKSGQSYGLEIPPSFALVGLGLKKSRLTPRRNKVLQRAEAIVKKHLVTGNWYPLVWQFPVVLAPISFDPLFSSDPKGESIILRPVDSVNAMTASVHKLPWPMVESIVKEITEKIPEVQAVFYDLTSKPPGTIEWE